MKYFFILALFLNPNIQAQEFLVPSFTGAVVDSAALLRPETRIELAAKLSAIYRAGGPQIAVLTVPDLNGINIEEASIKVVDQWQLGRKGKDDGVLLFISKSDRKIRIEVGRGLEGDLTDAVSKLIIVNIIRPEFKNSQFEAGILRGIDALLQKIYPQENSGAEQANLQPNAEPENLSLSQIFIIIIVLIFLFLRMILNRLSPFSRRSAWGGGGFFGGGGGSSSGGSDFGGGGGFSGGGSSGDW